jgi:hypothetical protein
MTGILCALPLMARLLACAPEEVLQSVALNLEILYIIVGFCRFLV